MMRTACIRLNVTPEQAVRLSALRTAYADACNRLVPLVQAARCWNRVALHQLGYRALRQQTSLGAQMACNAIFSVCKAYRSQAALGRIPQDTPDRKSTRLNSSHSQISYAVFCLKKKNRTHTALAYSHKP